MGGGRIVEGRPRGRRLTSVEVEWDEVENGKGSELSMKDCNKGFILCDGGEKTVEVKVFLAECCREEVLVIKDEVESVESFLGEAHELLLVLCV